MAAESKVFSLEGKGLKLDSAEDLEAHIGSLRDMEHVEEVRILGNTLGVGACKLLGEVLATKKTLKVGRSHCCFISVSFSSPDRVYLDCQLGRHIYRAPTERNTRSPILLAYFDP